MTRTELLAIKPGDTGLYEWNRACPVVSVEDAQPVLVGPRTGKLFRMVRVASATGNATISFIVRED